MAHMSQVTCWNELVEMGSGRGLHTVTVVTVTHTGPKLCLMSEVRAD